MIAEIAYSIETNDSRVTPARAGAERASRTATDPEEMARELLTMAAHDLCAPLAGIKLRAAAIASRLEAGEEPSSSEWSSVLLTLRRAADEACGLIDDLLAVERLTQPRTPAPAPSTDIVDVIQEAIGQQREALERARNPIQVQNQKGLERARGPWDRGYLHRVFGNLLRNAAIHAPGAPIQITLARQGDTLRVVFADAGAGLPSRANGKGPTPRDRGNTGAGNHGLGLWIVRRAVQRLGGRFRIRNTPGRGAAFEIDLPRLEVQDEHARRRTRARKRREAARPQTTPVQFGTCA